jgi:uncharacterized membrane protein
MRTGKTLPILFAVLVLVALLGTVSMGVMGAGSFGGMMGPGMMAGYAGTYAAWPWGWMMLAGTISMVAFWGAVIVGVALLVRGLAGQTPTATDRANADAPLAILQRRYAAGEIDQATYERMRQELAAGSGPQVSNKAA